MITLTGSEKQTQWANDIRTQRQAEVAAFQAQAEEKWTAALAKGIDAGRIEAAREDLKARIERLFAQADAEFWIRERTYSIHLLLKNA